ncbi:MAG: LysR family transcriptional regulator [Oscillospiraceae bacterium]|nr:LysR family transcriptional regulator [Oscillospiraceae bacterium]
MYNQQLKTFLTVCSCGSFSKAASLLFMTPSAVLHQIRMLEKDLDTELFLRTSKGVSLTPSGLYLEQHALLFVQMGDEIRRGLKDITSKEHSICIGTSMLEKCRLLYDLWVLFSAEEPDCQIQMSNIDTEHNIPENTDLIESFNSQAPWMHGWEFLEICRVPFGFAVVSDHPLAKKQVLTLDDLKGETVLTINDGSCETIASLLRLLRENGINVVYNYGSGMNMFWESAFRRDVQLVPFCFKDILINMTVVPFDREFLLPYGIFYRPNPHPAVQRFLDFVRLTYSSGNASGIVPVLE